MQKPQHLQEGKDKSTKKQDLCGSAVFNVDGREGIKHTKCPQYLGGKTNLDFFILV